MEGSMSKLEEALEIKSLRRVIGAYLNMDLVRRLVTESQKGTVLVTPIAQGLFCQYANLPSVVQEI